MTANTLTTRIIENWLPINEYCANQMLLAMHAVKEAKDVRRGGILANAIAGSVSFQVVRLIRPCSCSSANRLCSVHTVPSCSRRRSSRLCRSKRDVVRCATCPVAK